MTTRRRNRRHSRAPERAALMAAGLLLAYLAALAVVHVLGWLLATGAIAAGTYAIGQARRRATAPAAATGAPSCRHCAADNHDLCNGIGPCACPHRQPGAAAVRLQTAEREHLARVTAERDQLAALVTDLRRQVAEARDSMHAAWDASPAPRDHAHPAPGDDAGGRRAALLAQPLSGVRPLTPH